MAMPDPEELKLSQAIGEALRSFIQVTEPSMRELEEFVDLHNEVSTTPTLSSK